MPRTAKPRMVCFEFNHKVFTPDKKGEDHITLTLEELESLRLCDLEGFEQEMAANRMHVSRGTLQRVLYSARKKVAKALCEGSGLRIEGGNYKIASREEPCIPKCKKCIKPN